MASHHKFRQIGFAHLMEHLPFHTFRRWVQRYLSKYPTKLFSHLDQFLCMAFAQLTCHESLCNTETCLRCDRTIALTAPKASKDYLQHLGRIKFYDAVHDKRLVFLTDNLDLPALTVAQLYRCRWQIDILQVDQTTSSYQTFLRNY